MKMNAIDNFNLFKIDCTCIFILRPIASKCQHPDNVNEMKNFPRLTGGISNFLIHILGKLIDKESIDSDFGYLVQLLRCVEMSILTQPPLKTLDINSSS